MLRGNRKSTPKVVEGQVRKKNNWAPSADYYRAPAPRMVQVDRKRPGEGYRHVLRKDDIYRFLELLPDWQELAVGLNAIVLSPGRWGVDGYHVPGVVHLCAWDADLWQEYTPEHYEAHRTIFERLDVPCEKLPDGSYRCAFDEWAVQAYQLLHILLHELGHHHDRMTTRSQKDSARGERYAEEYALRHEASIWQAYLREFPRP